MLHLRFRYPRFIKIRACWVRSLTFALHCFVSAKIWVSFASTIPAGKTLELLEIQTGFTKVMLQHKQTSVSDSLQLDEILANSPSSSNYMSINTLADIFCDLMNSKAAVMHCQSHPLQRLYQVPVSSAAPASQQALGFPNDFLSLSIPFWTSKISMPATSKAQGTFSCSSTKERFLSFPFRMQWFQWRRTSIIFVLCLNPGFVLNARPQGVNLGSQSLQFTSMILAIGLLDTNIWMHMG